MSDFDVEPADLGYGDEAYTPMTSDDIIEFRRQGVDIPDDVADAVAAREPITPNRPTAREHMAEIAAAHGWTQMVDRADAAYVDRYDRGGESVGYVWNTAGTAALVVISTAADGTMTSHDHPLGLIETREILESPAN
ncbi:hypothetical protein JRC04_04950 [Mycolicibacterium sp. S2-37]|uniref:hypothetical protein n=1 Tax=Mycolicibacterium sp. S2-37 TaxID=2810297 RepID=UPI001A9422FA|nr:hypothetical protein [Mycolicibacterium sp. S2-37]MBO0676805.1 hypothetical protein [Mycolicibacterium sp. S2-37]